MGKVKGQCDFLRMTWGLCSQRLGTVSGTRPVSRPLSAPKSSCATATHGCVGSVSTPLLPSVPFPLRGARQPEHSMTALPPRTRVPTQDGSGWSEVGMPSYCLFLCAGHQQSRAAPVSMGSGGAGRGAGSGCGVPIEASRGWGARRSGGPQPEGSPAPRRPGVWLHPGRAHPLGRQLRQADNHCQAEWMPEGSQKSESQAPRGGQRPRVVTLTEPRGSGLFPASFGWLCPTAHQASPSPHQNHLAPGGGHGAGWFLHRLACPTCPWDHFSRRPARLGQAWLAPPPGARR